MLRHYVHPRMTFAAPPARRARGVRDVRQSAAGSWPLLVRVLLAPLALATAALAGALFAILLPVCGIATIAEGVARGAWSFARGVLPPSRQRS